MTLTNRLGRPMIATMFITGGIDQLRNPDEKVPAAKDVVDAIDEKASESNLEVPLPADARDAVRINGAVQVAAGTLLAINRVPRLASLALAGSLVPTTLAGHRFWDIDDEQERKQQQIHFFKNLAMFGGLLIAAGDTDGRPSVGWRARRAAAKAERSVTETVDAATLAAHDARTSARRSVLRRKNRVTDMTRDVAGTAAPVVEDASEWISDRSSEFADQAKPKLREILADLRDIAETVQSVVGPKAAEARDRAAELAGDARDRATDLAKKAPINGRHNGRLRGLTDRIAA